MNKTEQEIVDYINLIRLSYFASLYLNGLEYNFHITAMEEVDYPMVLAYDFFINGYMLEEYDFAFSVEKSILSTKSCYCVNAPDRKSIFNCQVQRFIITTADKNELNRPNGINSFQAWSSIAAHIRIPRMAFAYGPYSSIEQSGFKLKEDSQPIGSNIYDRSIVAGSQLINRAMLFDWDE
jgi:hypothetical protein